MEKLLDTLPTVAPNAASVFGPILACDHGYGKKTIVFGKLSSSNNKLTLNLKQKLLSVNQPT
jgi:hypothetical protein